jgi:hypothetical protein
VAHHPRSDVEQPVAQRLGPSRQGRRPRALAPATRRCGATGRTAGCAGRWPYRSGSGPRSGRAGGGAAPAGSRRGRAGR